MLVFAISNIGTKLILFFLVPLYTKYMSSSQYGTADLITTTTNLFVPLVTLSITESVYRFTIDKSTNDRDVIKCFYYMYGFSTLITVLTSIILAFIPSIKEYAPLFALITLATIANDGYALFVKGRGQNKVFAIDNIVYVATLALSNAILLIYFNLGVAGYLLALVLSKIISLLYLIIFGNSPKFVPVINVDKQLLKKMLRYSIPLLFNSINWWIISSSDKYMLNYFLGSAEVGLYSVATKIPALLNTATTVFTEAWTIASIKEHDEGRGSNFYNSVFELFSVSMAILVCFIMLIARPFIDFYVSEDYYSAVIFLPTLLMSAYYLGYSSFIGVTFSTVMKSGVIMKSSLYAAGINILFNLVLIPKIGGLGAAIATMATYIVISFYRYIKAQKYMPLSISKLRFLGTIIILTIQQIIVTLDIAIIPISMVCFALLVVTYIRTIKHIFIMLKSIIKNRFERKK